MSLSGRLAVAMVGLALLTAVAVGGLSYITVRNTVLPRALDRFDLQTALVAAKLDAMFLSAVPDLRVESSGLALNGMVRASLADGIDPVDGGNAAELLDRVVNRFTAILTANPTYMQLRLIGIGDGGREIIRVDRNGTDGAVRIVPPTELQQKGDRPYFTETIRLSDGEVYVSPVELNQENGRIQEPHVPVLRVGMPIYANGAVFGALVLNVDMRGLIDVIRTPRSSGQMVLVNADGDYLAHPDRGREFGFDLGQRHRIQDDFPGLKLLPDEMSPSIQKSREGAPFGLGGTMLRLAGGPRVGVIQIVPYDEVLGAVRPMRNSIALAGLIAVLGAAALAFAIARSMARPLEQMAEVVGSFSPGKEISMPVNATGEIGVLAKRFEHMATEVTSRTAEVTQQARIFDMIMNSMAEMVMLFDERARLVYANPAAKNLLGVGPDVGTDRWKATFEVLPNIAGAGAIVSEDRPIIRAIGGEPIDNLEMIYRRNDGTMLNVVINGRPIRAEGNESRGAVMVVRDVTLSKQVEYQLQQAQKLDAIGKLTGGVAHDFNNILTVIMGTSDLLIESLGEQSEFASMVQTIEVAAERGAELTSQLLSFARRQTLQPVRTDVNGIVREVAKLLKPTLGENVEIELILDNAAWQSLIDPSQLSTALLNLAVNARDSMPEGGKLTLETENTVLDAAYAAAHSEVVAGPYVMVAVSDTGEGISEEVKNHIFEPFFTTKAEGKGTGLGLAMVYGFVKQSNGHIKIYSEVGHGTTVKLYLPRSADTPEEVVSASTAPTPHGHETILLVEDDEQVRAYAMAVLISLGYRVLEAANGAQALAMVEAGAAFDLLFTDVIMPGGMNGRQLAAALAERIPDIRVLYCSGYTENAIIHHGRLDPGVHLLAKPYRKADLARKLRDVLGRSV